MSLFSRCTTLTLFLLLAASISSLFAQDPAPPPADTSGWKLGGNFGVNFSQIALSNWSGGGKNAVNIAGILSLFANDVDSISSWTNSLETGYGFTKLAKEDMRKSDDRLTLVSSYGYNASSKFLYSALLDFRTQLTDGLDYTQYDSATGSYPVQSRFLAPGRLKVGVGMTYRPAKSLEILLAPLSNQLTLVLDDSLSAIGAFGVEPGKKAKSELGSLLNVLYQDDVMENVALKTRLSLFAPYDRFTTVVVTWESLLNLTVNDFLNASVSVDVVYDDAVKINRDDGTTGPSTQVREVLALGLGYKF